MKSAPKIVVLEDDRSSRALITVFLEKAGYHVYEASEGRYAIELVMKQRPALLIADVMLPDINGSEVVKKLLATAYGRPAIDILAGNGSIRAQLEADATLAEIEAAWQVDLARFKKVRERYLIYEG